MSETWFEKQARKYEPMRKECKEEEPEEMDGLRQHLANKEKRTFRL